MRRFSALLLLLLVVAVAVLAVVAVEAEPQRFFHRKGGKGRMDNKFIHGPFSKLQKHAARPLPFHNVYNDNVNNIKDEGYAKYELVHVPRSVVNEKIYQFLQTKHDIWTINESGIDVMTPRGALQGLFEHTVLIKNVEEYLNQMQFASTKNAEYFEEYHTMNDSLSWFQDLAAQYPTLINYVSDIGTTHENRRMVAVHITAPNNNGRPQVWIQAGIHAREWISPAVQQFFVHHIVTNFGTDSDVTDLLNNVEFIFIPFVNPDGYEFTWTDDRLWRKNRLPSGNGIYGVDLNRNYDLEWGGVGSSSNPASETYRGPSAASEPEVQNLVAYFKSLKNVVGAIDIHSYSQYILWPWAYTPTATTHGNELETIAKEMADLIEEVHGTRFSPGQWYTRLYASSGVGQDWYYNQVFAGNHPYSFTVELRPDTSIPGFLLPPEEIIPSGEEMIAAFIRFAKNCYENPLKA